MAAAPAATGTALFDLVTARVLDIIGEAGTGEGPWTERVDRTLAAYFGVLVAEPALTRSYMQELPAVTGGAAHVRAWNIDRARYEAAVREFLQGIESR